MKYHQRDIVEVSFFFPDGTFKPHPAIIVSNDELQDAEDGMFYLVLITSNDWLNPQYSYCLTDEMIVGHTFAKPSVVKCQINTCCYLLFWNKTAIYYISAIYYI